MSLDQQTVFRAVTRCSEAGLKGNPFLLCPLLFSDALDLNKDQTEHMSVENYSLFFPLSQVYSHSAYHEQANTVLHLLITLKLIVLRNLP